MSISIDNVLGFSITASSNKQAESSTTADFSAILQNMKSAAAGGSNGGDDSSSETETYTRIMPDGTLVVTTTRDGEVISQTKTKPDAQAQSEGGSTSNGSYGGVLSSDILSLLASK